jgi:glycerol uptake facilitator protein
MPSYFLGQILGAMMGSILVWIAFYPHFGITQNHEIKFVCFATKPAIRNYFWNFTCEVIGTAMLLIGVLGIFNKHNGIADGVGPYAVGILIFSIGLSLGGPTGYAINPARDLGPRLVHALFPIQGKGGSDWRYAWVPILGPLVGGALGALIYQQCIAGLSPL